MTSLCLPSRDVPQFLPCDTERPYGSENISETNTPERRPEEEKEQGVGTLGRVWGSSCIHSTELSTVPQSEGSRVA